jgi:hypothetical protein
MEYAKNAWLFFAVSIPLTLFTISVWYTWANSRRLYHALLSARKEHTKKVQERIKGFTLAKEAGQLPR